MGETFKGTEQNRTKWQKRTVFTPQRYEPRRKTMSIVHTCIEKSMDPPGLILKEINDYIGKGVFAGRKFPMGSFLMEYHGELISKKEGINREKAYPKEYGSFLLFFKCGRTEMCVDATFSTQLGRFANDAVGYMRNADLRIVFVNRKPHVVLFAARNICKGEEIRYDYGVSNLPWRRRHKERIPHVLLKRLDPGADTHSYRNEDGTFSDVVIIRHLKTKEPLLNDTNGKGTKRTCKTTFNHFSHHENNLQTRLADEPSESSDLAEETPKSSDLAKTPPESLDLVGETSESSDLAETQPGSSNLVEETPKSSDLAETSTELLDLVGENPESSDLAEKKPESSDLVEEIPESSDLAETTPESSDLAETPTESSDLVEKPTESSDLAEENPESSDLAEKLPESSDLAGKPSESSELAEETPEDSDVAEETPESSDMTEEIPESSDMTEETPQSSDMAEETPDSSDIVPQSSDLAENTADFRQTFFAKKVDDSDHNEDKNEFVWTETEKTDENLLSDEFELLRETMPDDSGVIVLHVCKKKTNTQEEIPTIQLSEKKQQKVERKKKKNVTEGASLGLFNSKLNYKGAKPYRPCPFCFEFKAKLLIHLKSKHKDQREVKHALSLPPNQQKNAFAKLRKMGIYQENVKRIREKGNLDKVELIRERKQGNGNLITCMGCRGFISRSQFYRHRKICASAPFLDPPSSMEPLFLANMKKNEHYENYQIEVLGRFRKDEVGDLCRTDHYITAYGYHKFLSIGMRKRKKDEKRKSLMNTMRRMSKIYIEFKAVRKGDTTCSLDMFLRSNKHDFKETIYTRKRSSTPESNLLDGNTVKTFGKFLRDMLSDNGDDDHHAEMNKFLHTLSYNWRELFGDSERETRIRRSEKRKPANLPVDSDLKTLRKYTLEQLEMITSDVYNFIAETEFTFLRDLLVSRLTLYNARRGGEPSRLTLDEWRDAEKGTWLELGESHKLENPEDMHLLKQIKIAYQTGKNDGTLVPVMFPSDCLAGIKLLSDPVIRKDAGVSPKNVYLFPRTQLSEFHVIGTTSIDTICKRVGVKSVTATKVRHRTSTLHAKQHRTEDELKAFHDHMGHSDSINKHVYQCPPAVAEITKVGRFLQSLDSALQLEENSIGVCEDSNSSPPLKALQLEENSTGLCEDLNNSSPVKALQLEENSKGLCEDLNNSSPVKALQPERTSAAVHAESSGSSCIESDQAHSSAREFSRISLSLKGFLYTVANTQAVQRVLKNHELIEEHEVETKPEEVFQVSYDHHVLHAAKPYFTTDGWLAVKHLLAHAIELNRATVTLQNSEGSGLCLPQIVEQGDTPDSTFCEENDNGSKGNVTHELEEQCRQDMSNRTGKSVERYYTRWRKEDTEMLNKHFAKYVYDVARFDTKGSLPGYTEIRRFLKIHPDFLARLPVEQKLKTIHTKLYNERNKSRSIAKGKLQYD